MHITEGRNTHPGPSHPLGLEGSQVHRTIVSRCGNVRNSHIAQVLMYPMPR